LNYLLEKIFVRYFLKSQAKKIREFLTSPKNSKINFILIDIHYLRLYD